MPNYTCNVCLLPKNGDYQARVPAPQPAPAIGQAQATVPTVQPSPAPALPHAPGSAEVPGPAFLAPAPGPSRQPSTAPTLSQAPGCSRTPASGLAQTLRQQSALASGTTHLAQVTAQESGQQPVSEPSRVLQPTQVSVIEPHRTTPALGPGEILVRAVGRTNRICSVCGQEARQLSMQEVSGMLSACTWVAAETFLPMKNRICNVHVENGRLSQAALESLSKRSQMKEQIYLILGLNENDSLNYNNDVL
ncbi:unnamed protein product [Allacma fusca]|uniref:Uncharacterized protein n=1 Tax=Allacma fusca TaxID=39272 RepID=A0A8J2J869_9HEXA|nr:unnamed protein product [Allacma fusca]